MSIWINPQGEIESNGGGGTPSVVRWSDIKEKPLEFTPKAHTHVIADVKDLQGDLHTLRTLIKNNQENITLIIEGLDDYVMKEDGKALSSNDFTDELKLALEALIESEGGGITGDYVISVNGKSGVLEITKNDIGLGNVLNQEQATKTEFDNFKQTTDNQFTNIDNTLKTKANTQDITNQLADKADTTDVLSLLSKKVDKKEGYQLSQNDFTNEHREKLESIDSGGSGGEIPSGAYVETINGKSGKVIINKETLGLDSHYTTKEDFQEFTEQANIEHAEVRAIANSKVSQEEGKGLSEANFTNAEKNKLSQIELQNLEHPVTSVNGKTGEVVLNSGDLGLENVKNIEQATKSEFDTHVSNKNAHVTLQEKSSWNAKETTEGAQNKATKAFENAKEYTDTKISAIPEVDLTHLETKEDATKKLVEAKNYTDTQTENLETVLGSQEKINQVLTDAKSYTDSEIKKIPVLDDKHLATKSELNTHIENSEVHVNQNDKLNIDKIPELDSRISNKVDKEVGKGLSTNDFTTAEKNKIQQVDTLSSTISGHISDNNVHLNERQKELIESLPEISSDVQALDNEINRILELLGEGGEVSDKGVLEVVKKGHLYAIGDIVYDIIGHNSIQGTLARRYALDNIETLSNPRKFYYNRIFVHTSGYLKNLADIINEDDEEFGGLLTDVIDFGKQGVIGLTINGNVKQDIEFATVYNENYFHIYLNEGHFDEMLTSRKGQGSIVLDMDVTINTEENAKFNEYGGISHDFSMNEIHFHNLHQHKLKADIELYYQKDVIPSNNHFELIGDVVANVIHVDKDVEHAKIIYKNLNSKPYRGGLEDKGAPANTMGVKFQINRNSFDSEVTRRFNKDFVYLAERMENPDMPIFNNITMIHYLSMADDLSIKQQFNKPYVNKELVANPETEIEKANLKNIVISKEEPTEIYEGMIWIKNS